MKAKGKGLVGRTLRENQELKREIQYLKTQKDLLMRARAYWRGQYEEKASVEKILYCVIQKYGGALGIPIEDLKVAKEVLGSIDEKHKLLLLKTKS